MLTLASEYTNQTNKTPHIVTKIIIVDFYFVSIHVIESMKHGHL